MGATCLAPDVDLRREVAQAASGNHHVLPAELLYRSAEAAHPFSQPIPGVDAAVDVATDEDETVRQPGSPVERRFPRSAQPDRDGPRRPRHQSRSVDAVEAAREIDNRFCEQPAEQLDLLLLAGTAGMEVLPQS